MKCQQQGFTLFEVLISMFIAGVAVLGLVMLELNILRSSQSSFNYTIATIEANTLIDQTWRILCERVDNPGEYSTVANGWHDALDSLSDNSTSFTGTTSSGLTTFTVNDAVMVSWTDKIQGEHNDINQLILSVSYPDFTGGCK